MNIHPSDLSAAAQRGITLKDPRIHGFLQQRTNQRIQQSTGDAISRIQGGQLTKKYPNAKAWLHDNPKVSAPIWLGHNPEVSLYTKGIRNFILFASRGIHKASLFEILGKNFRRIL